MQSKDKNDSIRLSERYQCYMFAKRHLRGTSRPEVLPVPKNSKNNLKYLGGVVSSREQRIKDGKYDSQNFSQGQLVYDKSGISQTLAAQSGGLGGKTGLYADGARIRRLTPVEAERLQGFPDGWTEKGVDINGNCVIISNSQRYKVMGNAVTVNVIEAIMRKFLKEEK